METKGEMQHLEFEIPSRGLIGLRTQMLTATTGEAVMAHRFNEYKPWKGNIPGRNNGVLISKNTGRQPLIRLINYRTVVHFLLILEKKYTQDRSLQRILNPAIWL
jgi:predicted membrane GTPase involved in stress response